MWYVGLDVHLRFTVMVILNARGVRIKRERIDGAPARGVERLRELREKNRRRTRLAVCYEASCGYGPLHDGLRKVASRVVVAHPGQLRLIFRSKRKNDRVDAEKLATLLFLDQVPAVHVPSIRVRSWRNLIEYRHRLVAKRTRAKNGLRSLFRGHGMDLPSGCRLWTRRGLALMVRMELPTSEAALQRDLLLEEVQTLNTQLKRVEQELAVIAGRHPGVYVLMTIPGVGIRTAEAAVAYIDDAKRFRRNKSVGSYFGLVPCQDQSADLNRLGHITREGPATVRKLLTEAAWQGIRRSPQIRCYFERIQGGDPKKRKKIALVATAHYLIRVMHAMLRTGEVWREKTTRGKAA